LDVRKVKCDYEGVMFRGMPSPVRWVEVDRIAVVEVGRGMSQPVLYSMTRGDYTVPIYVETRAKDLPPRDAADELTDLVSKAVAAGVEVDDYLRRYLPPQNGVRVVGRRR
jgi:hypothetical protein